MQTWSAAAAPFMVIELLGLDADGFAKRLQISRPLLPDGVDVLALHGVRVRDATVSLRFTRHPDGAAASVTANDSGI